MAGINNKYDYRDGVLTALGVEHTPSDVRNEDEYRKKVLDGFGVEYTDDDINRKHLYREKVVNGLTSGGGGSSDFSTAEVTIVIGSNATGAGGKWPQPFPTIENDSLNTFFIVENNLNKTFTVPLYKGEARAMYWGTNNVQNASFTGNIALDTDDDDILVITGNGTITVTKF